MVEFENPGCQELFLRLPMDREGFLSHGLLFQPSDEQTYSIENRGVRFNFARDQVGGFHLQSMERLAGPDTATWTNREWNLWQVIVFDATQTDSLDTSLVLPQARFMAAPTQSGNTITLQWIGHEIGGVDALNVTVTLELRPGEDWLRASATFEWMEPPSKYALDSTCVLPVRIASRDRGSDFAVLPAVFGVLSEDPIDRLRYNPNNGGTTASFGNHVRNIWNYPSGRGWKMGFWGYYSSVDLESWMGWTEQWDQTLQAVCFQSDGEGMLLENFVTCEDNVLVGNNGRTIATTDWCIRPLKAVQTHAWWDIANHYKQRLEEVRPSWLVDQRIYRSDLSEQEKGPFLFLDVVHTGYTGSASYLPAAIQNARTAIGATPDVPAFLILESDYVNTYYPYETEIGDMRATFATLTAANTFSGQWRGGIDGPQTWDLHQWKTTELRWWTTNQGEGALRQSRRGMLLEDGRHRLSEGGDLYFYREANYPIVSWNAGSKVLTITGDPTADDTLVLPAVAVLIPASSAVRLAYAVVSVLASGSITVTTAFKDVFNNVIVPTNADTVELVTVPSATIDTATIANQGNGSFCPHAITHATAFSAQQTEDTVGAAVELCGVGHMYMDVFTQPICKQPIEYWITCYRDHSTWGKLDGGTTQHPLGGGSWYVNSQMEYCRTFRTALRNRQQSFLGKKAALMACEDLDETMLSVFDYCWHTMASGDLFRVTNGIDPTLDKYKAIPLMSVVHAGRILGRALNHEFSSLLALSTSPIAAPTPPKEDTLLHRTQAYYLGSEWVYGITLPTLSFWADGTNLAAPDLFDDTIYVSGGGSVFDEVKSLRDLWVQMQVAELTWIQQWLRYGEFLPPAEVDFNVTDWTVGYADSFYTGQYSSYDILYERAQYPNIVHAVWRSQANGSVLVIFTNWTNFTSSWSGTISLEALNLGRRDSTFAAKMLDYQGSETGEEVDFDPTTGGLSISGMAPYSIAAILLTPTPIDSSIQLIATWRKGAKRQGQLQ